MIAKQAHICFGNSTHGCLKSCTMDATIKQNASSWSRIEARRGTTCKDVGSW